MTATTAAPAAAGEDGLDRAGLGQIAGPGAPGLGVQADGHRAPAGDRPQRQRRERQGQRQPGGGGGAANRPRRPGQARRSAAGGRRTTRASAIASISASGQPQRQLRPGVTAAAVDLLGARSRSARRPGRARAAGVRGASRRRAASAVATASSTGQRARTRECPLTSETVVMRVAIVSDIHGNRHAFEAVLDAIAETDCRELWCLGDLVGYGADPDACVDAGARACGDLPGRQPRSRRARHDPARAVLPRGGAGGDLDPADDHPRDARSSWRPRAPERRGGGGALPRQPARPGLGVRALAAAGRAVPGRPGPADLADRPLPRGAVVLPRPRRPRDRPDPRRRARSSTCPRASGWSTPAASASPGTGIRGPPGWSSTWTSGRRSTGAPNTTSPAPPRRSGPPGCPTRWPSACSTGSSTEPPPHDRQAGAGL